MKITQTKFGEQPRAYADREYEWKVELEPGETLTDDIIRNRILQNTCLSEALPKEMYLERYRDGRLSFDEHMTVVCKGYFFVKQTSDNTRILCGRKEYID